MQTLRRFSSLLLLLIVLTGMGLTGCSSVPDKTPPSEAKTGLSSELETSDERVIAILEALRGHVTGREDLVYFLIFQVRLDHVDFSADGKAALVWLNIFDPESGVEEGTESALALALLTGEDDRQAAAWKIVVQADPDWVGALVALPQGLMDEDLRVRYTTESQSMQKAPAIGGYKLPWQPGLAKRVSGSVGHVFTYKTCPSTCLYAFDFADGTMFPVLAARSGQVKYAVWQHDNGNEKHANYLVLEDSSTNPTTYQVYYHLAQNSIPPEFRVRGAQVFQGQFIGNADDTGPSSGHHLHFHVHTNRSVYWGNSVDITFDDVKINGGRPRTCAEAKSFPGYGSQCQTGNLYVSGNGDNNAPTGGLDAPKVNFVVTEPVLAVKGWAKDDTAIKSVQLTVNWDGTWRKIGPELTTSPFAVGLDLCAAGIPDGPFLLGMQVQDQTGKLSEGVPGKRLLEKKFDCTPPPAKCEPNARQVALYRDINLEGVCQTLEMGDYANNDLWGGVKNDDVESIKVGSEVVAWLYADRDFSGQSTPLLENDGDLSDNPVGLNVLSSLRVAVRPPAPAAPQLIPPVNALDLPLTEQDEVTLLWHGVDGAEAYRAELSGSNGVSASLDWQNDIAWQVGPLPVGSYTWVVWARNLVGEAMSTLSFDVQKADVASESRLLPVTDPQGSTVVHLRWEVQTGAEDLDHFELQYRMNGGEWQNWSRPLSSQMREVVFFGEIGKVYQFRLRSVDQNGHEEPYPEGHEVEVGFEAVCQPDGFDTVEPGDNRWTDATPLDPDTAEQQHNFCAAGDEDWVTFPAFKGKTYRFAARSISGYAAAGIQLYDTNGYGLLGEQKSADLAQDATLEWSAPQDGIYYLRLTPQDARLSGSRVIYGVKIDTVGQVFAPPLFCSAMILPLIWAGVKLYYQARRKLDED